MGPPSATNITIYNIKGKHNMFTQNQIEEIVDLLYTLNENTKIYLGCDSVRFKKDGKRYAKFASVCVVHMNGKNGCKVFRHRSVESDYDLKSNRPSMRLMNEVQKVCELYVQLAPFIDSFPIEIHLDLNTDPKHGSNCVATQAAGYVLGTTGIIPKLKPDAFAASFSADHFAQSFS